jgi:hypothetical protein
VLSDVRNGVVATASIGASESGGAGGEMQTTYGKMAVNGLDLGAIAAIAGSGPGAPTDLRAIYADYSYDGGSVTSPLFQCSFGPVKGGEFAMRPLSIGFAEVGAALTAITEAAGSNPPPEAMATYLRFVGDILLAVKSEAATATTIGCAGKGDDGNPFVVSLAGAEIGEFGGGVFPSFAINGLDIGDGGKNKVSLDSFTLKSIDLNPTIAALTEAGTMLDETWLAANGRKLIPAVAGFALSGLVADVENPDKVGDRIDVKIANFDLSLADYVNGIPSNISTTASGVDVPLPADAMDETAVMLREMGIERVNLGFELQANWDKAAQAINVAKAAVSGVDLGSISVGANLGNATETLFDLNPQLAMMSSFGLTLKTLTIELTDDGFSTIVVNGAAKQQSTDPATFRAQMAAGLEGMAIQVLGATDSARALGAAISEFVSGSKKTLTITLTSKAPAGVPVMVLMGSLQQADDPTKLGPMLTGLVDITGSAR